MHMQRLQAEDYRRQRWKNNGGWTTQLATCPNQSDVPFDWRISIAEIEQDGEFSLFPGYDRAIALLDGNGVELQFDQAPTQRLQQRLHFIHFAGEWKTFARLIDGPTRDFNVITKRHRVQAEVLHRPLVDSMVFFFEANTCWFIYCVSGNAMINDQPSNILNSGDSLLLQPDLDNMSNRIILEGAGELIIVKLVTL